MGVPKEVNTRGTWTLNPATMPQVKHFQTQGFLRKRSKTSKTPRRPFEKERMDAEMKIIGEYGLKKKREIWRVQYVLSKTRAAARDLLTLDDGTLVVFSRVLPSCVDCTEWGFW